jgi:SAM-dependent methyltransferase
VNCPLCKAEGLEAFRVQEIPIEDCPDCGHRFAAYSAAEGHIENQYSDAYFFEGGAGYSNYLLEEKLLRRHGQRYATLLRNFSEPGQVLAIGCAAGFTLQGLVDQGWEAMGLEPNSTMANYACKQLGLQVRQESLENCAVEPWLDRTSTGLGFDLVTWIQVLPHFVSPRKAMEQAAKLTRPGGLWLIEAWDRESKIARTLGSQWHEYSPPSVLHWFTPDSIAELAKEYGFSELERGRPKKYISAGHVFSLLEEKTDNFVLKGIVRLGAKITPTAAVIPYPGRDVFWTLLRKNFH